MRRALLVATLLLAGCGGDDKATPAAPAKAPSPRLVDFSKKPPFVNTLDIDPQTLDFLLTTNKGFWRIAADGSKVTPVKGTATDAGKSSPVGTFLEIRSNGPGKLLGSGHPDVAGALPNYLGLMRSDDGGKTWTAISRMADADLHKIVLRHDKLYAFDAILSAMLISTDGGKTFTEEFTPRGLVIDFEVDPADPDRIIASTETELFRTEDAGRSWRPLEPARASACRGPRPRRSTAPTPTARSSSPRTAERAGTTSAPSAASPTSCTPPARRRCSQCSATGRSSRPRMEEPHGAIASGPDAQRRRAAAGRARRARPLARAQGGHRPRLHLLGRRLAEHAHGQALGREHRVLNPTVEAGLDPARAPR